MIFLRIAFVLLLAGCASPQLPTNNGKNAVLLIPKETLNSTSESWSSRFELLVCQSAVQGADDQCGVEVTTVHIGNDNAQYILVDDLPAGQYHLHQISRHHTPKWRGMGSATGNVSVINIPFELEQGQVTILDRFVSIRQFTGAFGSGVSVGSEIIELPETVESDIIQALKTGDQFRYWKIKSVDRGYSGNYGI